MDDGGTTRWGIAQRYHPNVDVANLTREGAVAIYRSEYWDKLRCDDLPPGLAFLAFDLAVNPGSHVAVDLLQLELRVEVDGVVGPDTLAAARHAPVLELISALTQRRVLYYVDQMRRYPWKQEWFPGWIRRSARAAVFAARMVGA